MRLANQVEPFQPEYHHQDAEVVMATSNSWATLEYLFKQDPKDR